MIELLLNFVILLLIAVIIMIIGLIAPVILEAVDDSIEQIKYMKNKYQKKDK